MSGIELNGDKSVEDVLSSAGIYASVTKGYSMYPMLRSGRDVVYIIPLENKPKMHDVILFRTGEKYVLHRIIKITDKGYITRGDNNFFKEYVPAEAVIGVLIRYFKNGKNYATDTLRQRTYARYLRISYPLRFVLRKTRNLLGKIKRKLIKK